MSTAERTVKSQSQDEAQIRQLIAERETAMKARDADRIIASYAPEIVKFDLAPPLQKSGPEVHDASRLRGWFSGFDGPIEYEVRDLNVTVGTGGDVAFCYGLNRLSATPRGSSESFDLWYRATFCLQKIGGAWRIAHEHTSTPFYMDGTFSAALDLKP